MKLLIQIKFTLIGSIIFNYYITLIVSSVIFYSYTIALL